MQNQSIRHINNLTGDRETANRQICVDPFLGVHSSGLTSFLGSVLSHIYNIHVTFQYESTAAFYVC